MDAATAAVAAWRPSAQMAERQVAAVAAVEFMLALKIIQVAGERVGKFVFFRGR